MTRRFWAAAANLVLMASCSMCDPHWPYGRPHPGKRFIIRSGFSGCIELTASDGGVCVTRDGFQIVDARRKQKLDWSCPTPKYEVLLDEVWVTDGGSPQRTNQEPVNRWSESVGGGPIVETICFGAAPGPGSH